MVPNLNRDHVVRYPSWNQIGGIGEPRVWGISAVLGGWGSPEGKRKSLIGTLWETVHGKRNELVCCSRVTTPAEDLHTIPYGGPSHDLIRASQKYMREMNMCSHPPCTAM